MIELPETRVLAEQINRTLVGKTIQNVAAGAFPHKFAWYSGNPDEYQDKLGGKTVTGAKSGASYACGCATEITCGDMLLAISTSIRYHPLGDKLPAKHQLLIEFDDFSHLSCTVQMWGAMHCLPVGEDGLAEGYKPNKNPTPFDPAFDEDFFRSLLAGVEQSMSVKAFLATEQRIPGLGNGVLHDILFHARINPRTRLEKLSPEQRDALYSSVKNTLFEMAARGGRDTEKDLFGVSGGYRTILSSKTLDKPCPVCGSEIVREAYLGGNVYYCPVCQQLKKQGRLFDTTEQGT